MWRELFAPDFAPGYSLPRLDFAMNHYGQPDVAMFDFTCRYAAETASRVLERHGRKLLMMFVGDSLLEVGARSASAVADGRQFACRR